MAGDCLRKQGSKLYTMSLISLSLAALIENLAFALPLPYFPNYALSLGAPLVYLGFFTSAFMVSGALLSQKFGSLSDKHGRKRFIIAGLLADVVLGSLTGIIQDWEPLLIIRTLNGVATAMVSVPSEALLVDQVPVEKRGEAIGFHLTLGMIGRFLGPVFGGSVQFIAANWWGLSLLDSYRIPFFVDSFLALLAIIPIMWKVKETRGEDSKFSAVSENDVDLSEETSFMLKILYIVALVNGFGVGFIVPIGVLYFGDVFQATPFLIGLLFSLSGFIGLSCNYFAGKLADRVGRKPIIAFGSGSSRLASIALPFTSSIFQATVLMFFRSFGFNIAMPATNALRADLVPSAVRGKLFGRDNAFFQTGMIIGPILSTWIYDMYRAEVFKISLLSDFNFTGAGLPFIISGILGLLALGLLLVFVKEPVKKTH